MDDLSNYYALSSVIRQQQDQKVAAKDEATSLLDESKKKITDITNPFADGLATQALDRVMAKGVNKLSTSLGYSLKEAGGFQQAYAEDGTKGVVRHAFTKILGKSEDESAEKTISSFSRSEFKKVRKGIKASLDNEISELSENQKGAFSHLLKQQVKDESEIPDRLERFQHNLQAGSDVLDQVKKNVPRESPDNEVQDAGEDEFFDAEETQEPINNLDDALDAQTSRAAEQMGNQPMDNVAEAAKESTPDVQEAASLANEAEATAAKTASKEGDSLLLDAAEKAGETAGKDDLIGGGPEDLGGDVVSLLVGGAVFLGGILGARHKTAPAPTPQPFINFSDQIGA